MNSTAVDFPTPVSPTRRMVYDLFVLFFDVLMIPFLRDSASLEKRFRKISSKMTCDVLESILVFHIQIVLTWASGKVVKDDFVAGMTSDNPRFSFP